MKKSEYLISELRGMPVYSMGKKLKRIGKVHSFIFHPHRRRVVGFTIKRPDIALMMHRPDLFVSFDGFDVEDGNIVIDEAKGTTGSAACKRLGVDWNECVIWQGLPLMTEDEQRCGLVGDVRFSTEDGVVKALFVDKGTSAGALLGVTEIPAAYIKGFKLGVGDQLTAANEEDFLHGAIILSSEALTIQAQGGLAERAGKASAVVTHKASQAFEKAKPVASDVAQKTGDAVNKGAYAVGKQLSKTKGMFSAFKEEYKRARYGEDNEE